ncbi:MAG: phosphoenolpyruvate--protein phosphotransferase [Candidatus Competibacteraceae bacterium]|nr:phosphoenolpyruvate--protein phosphotransferase [Candidatus Competibacteraceae bacterium]
MSVALHGVGISRGYAIGRASFLHRDRPEIAEYTLANTVIEQEVRRFINSVAIAKQQLREIRARIPVTLPADVTAFIDTHLLMLEDSTLASAPIKLIRTRRCNAEWALKLQRDLVVQVFDDMEDPYLRSRKDDVDHVVHRIQRILLANETGVADVISSRLEGRIVVAEELTPADTILMQHQGVQAFITEHGGPLSHTAILARSLGIPAVMGVRNARRYPEEDELLIVDGQQGVVLLGLDQRLLDYYHWKQQEDQRQRQELIKLKGQPAVTRDAVRITLHANIELPEDAVAVRQVQAAGVGLYRTEFLFMNRTDIPDEEEHLASYLHVIKMLEEKPITIRTVDLGADKRVDGGRIGGANPALGLRAIRLCLKDLGLFRPQLRAILRASAFGKVQMMIPMLSNTQELFQVLRLVEETKQELQARGQRFDERMPVGAMIEVPAAAICAAFFARHLNFLSIGTNDLIQYTLAIDRIDDEVNYLYDPLHPAVLHLIAMTIRAGQQANIPVSLCGEMAGDTRYIRLLLGLGLTHFSMHPNNILEIKRVIRESHLMELVTLVQRMLHTTDPKRFSQLVQHLTQH